MSSDDKFVIIVIAASLAAIVFSLGGATGSYTGQNLACKKICNLQSYTDGEYTSEKNVCNCWNVGKPEPIKLLKGN